MNPLRDHLSKIAQRMRARLTMRSLISNSEWSTLADEIEHIASQPSPAPLSPLPAGWSIQRGAEGVVHLMGPDGLTVARRDSAHPAERSLFQLAEALLQDQDRLPITGPMTPEQVHQWMSGCEPLARATLRHYLDLAERDLRESRAAA